ncbi:PP2C family protein-serine/threonine phosphatase [Streptomyces sp. S.PB5]|uniref:PP2C family protein-serine/threonine phosphatase n=1 Tax=Streptomyces sp. S.PB5 TaxID=3020844 RepID=UPI0025AF0760|nr:PP2C family protein-serine/threonine phosphatase [Streptomyces sp. S.PB5]MDN3023232.1 PP2C family protein-serine/threonine phosphatase [Streptomyces sp. S.PB5]
MAVRAVGWWRRETSTRSRRSRGRPVLALGVSGLLAVLSGLGSWQLGVAVLVIGPVLACPRLDARRTAAVVGWALLLALGAGAARGLMATPGFGIEFLVLLAGGTLAVRDAARHTANAAALARATEVAQASQNAILRPMSVEIGGIEVCARHHCAVQGASVCGDLYAVVHTPYGVRLLIGDVRGHDLDALRTTAATIGAFKDLAYLTPGLTDLVTALDARIAPELGPEDFVTAVLAEFAPGEVRLVNCGHPAPIRAGKQVRLLEPLEPTPPLGLHPEPRLYRFYLSGGDRILFYTDGLSEARDANGADFPLLERVGDALAALSPSDVFDTLYAMVAAHTGREPTDDIALALCRPTSMVAPSPAARPPNTAARTES